MPHSHVCIHLRIVVRYYVCASDLFVFPSHNVLAYATVCGRISHLMRIRKDEPSDAVVEFRVYWQAAYAVCSRIIFVSTDENWRGSLEWPQPLVTDGASIYRLTGRWSMSAPGRSTYSRESVIFFFNGDCWVVTLSCAAYASLWRRFTLLT